MSACWASPFLASSKKTRTIPNMMGNEASYEASSMQCRSAGHHLFWRAARKRGQFQTRWDTKHLTEASSMQCRRAGHHLFWRAARKRGQFQTRWDTKHLTEASSIYCK